MQISCATGLVPFLFPFSFLHSFFFFLYLHFILFIFFFNFFFFFGGWRGGGGPTLSFMPMYQNIVAILLNRFYM